MKCRILFVFMIFLVVRGMLVSPLSVLSAVNVVIVHQTALSLRSVPALSSAPLLNPVYFVLHLLFLPRRLPSPRLLLKFLLLCLFPLRRLQPPCLLLLCLLFLLRRLPPPFLHRLMFLLLFLLSLHLLLLLLIVNL